MGRIHAARAVLVRFRLTLLSLGVLGFTSLHVSSVPAAPPGIEVDASAGRRPSPATLDLLTKLRSNPSLSALGTPGHVDERYGVPSFFWATRPSPAPDAARGIRPSPERAARDHLARVAPLYRLGEADVRGARMRDLHDTGTGGVIATFRQAVDGVEVFRDEIKVLMDRDLALLAVSGFVPGRSEAGHADARAYRLQAPEAIARAVADFTGAPVDPAAIRSADPGSGPYATYRLAESGPAARGNLKPVRVKKVLFHLPGDLVPAWYAEVASDTAALAYVISARDGATLFRHSLVAYDAFTYRVWAETAGLRAPYDGPQGNSPSPHPTGLPDFYSPSFLSPSLVSLQNGPLSTSDPWLAPGASETNGNNVDAYVDLNLPDGRTAGDFRATTTAPNAFDRTYDTTLAPAASSNQQMASITQLFYTNNFLHDWFYDVGFDETAGNAQAANYGRGGIEGDPILAEAQDRAGLNNANMMTPADGASPRMQMFNFRLSPKRTLTVNSPAFLAGEKSIGDASANPASFLVTGNVAAIAPGAFAVTGLQNHACGAGPQWVHVADFNSDGRPDLATANYISGDVSVLLRQPGGLFQPAVSYPMGAGPYTVESSDLDHDGWQDLVCANTGSSTVSVRRGVGGGGFGAKTDFATGTFPAVAAIGRMDGDANDDIVTANYSGNSISVLLGNGLGGFPTRTDYTVGANPNWVAIGDLNGDLLNDIVTANSGAGTMTVRMGNGTGGFASRTDYAVGSGPLTLALGDLNGDDRLDVVTANSGSDEVAVLLNDGAGGFPVAVPYAVHPSPVTVRLADPNADGLLDVVVCCDASSQIVVLAGRGDGTLGDATGFPLIGGSSPYGVAVADLDSDGHPDLVSANFITSNVSVLAGQLTPSTEHCPPFPSFLTGRIALIDRGDCSFSSKIQEAMGRGAAGALIVNDGEGVVPMPTSPAIPAFMISSGDGAMIREAMLAGTAVRVTLESQPSLDRDGALDNQIVAHEWGHYLSNRLIADGSGLSNLQGGGLGEGWGDFVALLATVKPEDALVASNPGFTGVYGIFSYATQNSAVPGNSYYFARRYPYSSDFGKNPLTFQHIEDGVALPAGPPIAFGADGAFNSEVHTTGEVWCTMLWECYSTLLRDTGRLTFAEARERMRGYLVASLKLTPATPTFTEARDALLAAALATDASDHAAFCQAFALRGLGTQAVAPDRYDWSNAGAVESYNCGGVVFTGTTVQPELYACDWDGYSDAGEYGQLVVRFRNGGVSTLASLTVSLGSSSPRVSFPAGASRPVASLAPGVTDSVAILYRVTANDGAETVTFTPQVSGAGIPGSPQTGAAVATELNRDVARTGLDDFDNVPFSWVMNGWDLFFNDFGDHFVGALGGPWQALADFTSPPFVPATNAITIRLKHWYVFDISLDPPAYLDGGVVELSDDDGATWTDIGASATSNGYVGTLAATDNPLAGRAAFAGSPLDPDSSWNTVLAPVGSYAGRTCRLRLRFGTDSQEVSQPTYWQIDEVEVTLDPGSTFPFVTLGSETGTCSAVAVDEPPVPKSLTFALRGANPVRGSARFAFDLPRPSPVKLEVFDLLGRRVAVLADGMLTAGSHEARWSAPPAAGVYFARLRALGESRTVRTVVTP